MPSPPRELPGTYIRFNANDDIEFWRDGKVTVIKVPDALKKQ